MFLDENLRQYFLENQWRIPALSNQELINIQARAYLKKTDWYIIREIETNVPCPVEIKNLRQQARSQVIE